MNEKIMFNQRNNLNIMRCVHAKPSAADSADALLLRIIDGCLAAVIFVVPFVLGGRHGLGQLILVVLAVVATLAWALRQSIHPNPTWHPSWPLTLIAAGAILVILQIIPLPPSLLESISPQRANLLPLWNAGTPSSASLGVWPFISFIPAETLAGLVLFLTYGMLFFVTVQRIKAVDDVERFLRWCAVSAMCMATFGLVQYLAGNGKFFWFYNHPFSNTLEGVKGSFTNKNHFAHFLALGIGPLIWWLHHLSHRDGSSAPGTVNRFTIAAQRRPNELKTYFIGLALAVILFAGLMSLSRGGMAAMFIAAVVSATVCYWASARTGGFLATLAATCVLIGMALSIFGLDNVGRRLETLTSAAAEKSDWSNGRLTIWSSSVKASPDNIWLGTGVDSFREVYPIYTDDPLNSHLEFTHGENSYLQVLLETGAIGLGLVLAGIALWFFWCAVGWKGPARLKVCAGAIAGSLAAGTAHALTDFVWYVPACVAIMAILAACSLRVSQFASPKYNTSQLKPIRPLIPVAAAIVLLPIGAWMIHNRIGPAIADIYWNQYLIALSSDNTDPPLPDNADSTARRNAVNSAVEKENKLIDCLEKAVYWQPTHADAHLALAEAHLRLFGKLQVFSPNPMTLANIRDAAIGSEFSSRESLRAWMTRAFGDHCSHLDTALRHTRLALSLCPLQGRGYLYLAKLSFLDGKNGLSKQACIAQALRVRPFDGAVVYAAAAEAFLAGDTQQWLELSKRVLRCGREYKLQFIGNLISNTPQDRIGATIDFIITQFQPDLESLKFLHTACAKRCSAEILLPLSQYRALQIEFQARYRNDPPAAELWLEAQQLHAQLKNGSRALQCAIRATQCDQNNYRAHYQLALCLIEQRQFAEAESHLRWCMQRSPRDKSLEIRLKEALKGRLDAEQCATAEKKQELLK